MNLRLSRAGALLGATALAASSLIVTATAAQAVDTGTLVVTIVDQYGRPTQGVMSVVDPAGNGQTEDGASGPDDYVPGVTHTYTVPVGGYAFITITPWSGVNCFGVAPCNIAAGSTSITPVVNVAAGATVPQTLKVTVPTITGNPAVGSPLSLNIPEGITALQAIGNNAGSPITQQWLRGGAAIAGATGPTYPTVPADSAQAITARLSPSTVQNALPQAYGLTVAPFTTNAITLATFVPAKTKTKVKLPKDIRQGDRVSLKVTVKADSGTPDGVVAIKIGRSTVRKTLQSGSTFVNLPRLDQGRYKLSVKYAGTEYFAASKDTLRFTVRPQ